MDAAKPVESQHNFEDEREFFEERAGILEFEAGFSRDEAERLARIETLARYFGGDATTIIGKAAAAGVRVQLIDGVLHASGPAEVRDQWLPTLQRFRNEILLALKIMGDARRT